MHRDIVLGNHYDNYIFLTGERPTVCLTRGGDDTIQLGINDIVSGGRGADTFWFSVDSESAIITDFQSHRDTLNFSGVPGVDCFRDLNITHTEAGIGIETDWGVDLAFLVGADHLSFGDLIL